MDRCCNVLVFFRGKVLFAFRVIRVFDSKWSALCHALQVVLLGSLNVQLPNQWLWDMLDEFIYQFQSFCQFRAKVKSRTDEELAVLKQCGHVSVSCIASAR